MWCRVGRHCCFSFPHLIIDWVSMALLLKILPRVSYVYLQAISLAGMKYHISNGLFRNAFLSY